MDKKDIYVHVNAANVAMAVAESVKIQTKLALNFQTEEKFAPQHLHRLLSLVDLILFTNTCSCMVFCQQFFFQNLFLVAIVVFEEDTKHKI